MRILKRIFRITLLIHAVSIVFVARSIKAAEPMSGIRAFSDSIYDSPYLPEYACDNNLATRWASQPQTPCDLTIDLGQPTSVHSIALLWERAYCQNYEILASLDAHSWKMLIHQTHGHEGRDIISGLKTQTRYLRLHCIKSSEQYKHVSLFEFTVNPKNPKTIYAQFTPTAQTTEPSRLEIEKAKTQLLERGIDKIVFSVRADGNDGHWYANLGYWSYDEHDMLYGLGGRLCSYQLSTDTLSVLISDPQGTIRDPVIHYDAQKILFSWRKANSRVFHLYECDLNGKSIRQITDGAFDDIEPCYLPDGDIIFVSTRCKRYVNCWLTQVATIYRCHGDGSRIQQLSANIEQDNTPWVLPNGQIIYMRWEYIDRSQVDYHHLWVMNPDGTNQTVYYGNQQPSRVFIDPKPIPNSYEIAFICSPGHGLRDHSGALAVVSNKDGPDAPGTLHYISNNLANRDPWPISTHLFLVARNRSIMVIDDHGAEAALFRLPDTIPQHIKIQEPRPVIRREREPIVVERTRPDQANGTLILQNITQGRNMGGVKPGEITQLLIVESLPKPINFTGGMDPLSYGGSFTLESILGTVPVYPDGSAYIKLPANRSLFFIALDKNNNSVKRMQSFTSVMPGEVQSCVGCHEHRTMTAINHVAGSTLMALQSPPSVPSAIAGIPDVFDYPRDIQPILDKHCISCHNSHKFKGKVDLTGDRGPMFSLSYIYLTLKKQFVDGRNLARSNYPPRSIGASVSPLMQKIDGSHHQVKLNPHEQDMIRYWIETSACYPGTYAALGHGAIGGYQKNNQINLDSKWPTWPSFSQVVKNRCMDCHKQQLNLPTPESLSDEIGLSFWRFDLNDKRLKFSRHRVFNLTHPEESLFLLAPLARQDDGLQICQGSVFKDKSDPDYQLLLNHILAGKKVLEEQITRFDMPQFMPRPEYFRELKRYGILSHDFDPTREPFDVYELDRQYWQSLWYQPESRAQTGASEGL